MPLTAGGALKPEGGWQRYASHGGRGFAASDTETLCHQPPGLPRDPDPGLAASCGGSE